MLKNVKTSYFLRIIFSCIEEKQKLKLIKYNKNLQEKLNIRLINYKLFSRRYIIFESKEEGKEYYYDGTLEFEGEYLNGLRNGKGREYYYNNGNLKFEGEYINGERNGKGKKYYDYKLEFEGEYLNGFRNGKGKEYDNDELRFEGVNGQRNGKGKEYNDDGELKFEGEYLNGQRNGKGKEYNYDGELIFEVEYLKNIRCKGNIYDKSGGIIIKLNKESKVGEEYDDGILLYEC